MPADLDASEAGQETVKQKRKKRQKKKKNKQDLIELITTEMVTEIFEDDIPSPSEEDLAKED